MSETTQSATVQQLPSKASFKRLADCRTLQEAFETRELKDRIAAALPRHLDPDTMLRTFVQACSRQPLIYRCDLRQSLGAFMSLSYLGLPPGTMLNLAHLIPFKTNRRVKSPSGKWEDREGYDLTVIIGYPGYVELAFRSGFVRDIATGIVLPGDFFEFERGSKRFLAHRPQIDKPQIDTDTPRAGWAMAKFVNDGEEFEVMGWAEILAIRNRSQAYRRALAAKTEAENAGRRLPATWTEAPWVAHERQMARKTVLRRLSTLLPKCPELRAGIGIDQAADAGKKLDFGPIIDGVATPMDGVPEAEETDAPTDAPVGVRPAPDPTAAHADRRPAKPDKTRSTPARPAFEAVLVDQYGQIIGEFTDPVAFAGEIVRLWNASGDPALRENNIDAIEEARRLPGCAAILKQLDTPPQAAAETEAESAGEQEANDSSESLGDESGPAMPFEPVRPVVERGKPDWKGWVNALRDEAATCEAHEVNAWAEAQRPVIAEAPIAQRALGVKAVIEAYRNLGAAPPGWLAELLTPNAAEKDQRWLDDLREQVEKMPRSQAGRAQFDALIANAAVRTVMARLERENRALFDQANALLAAANGRLPKAGG